jgi:hypothetical protein
MPLTSPATQRRCPSLCAPGAAHHAKLAVPFHHAARHEAVARLEDVERQLLAGEHHVHHKQGQHLRGRASRPWSRDAAPKGSGRDHGASRSAGGPPSGGGSAGWLKDMAHHLDHRPNRYVSREAACHRTAHRRIERDSPSGAAPKRIRAVPLKKADPCLTISEVDTPSLWSTPVRSWQRGPKTQPPSKVMIVGQKPSRMFRLCGLPCLRQERATRNHKPPSLT